MEATERQEKWIERFRKTMDAMPKELWIFVGNNINIMKKKRGQRAFDGDSYDANYSIDSVWADCDGGDF